MGDNDTAAAAAAAAAPAAPYVFLFFLYKILVELFAIRTSLDWICSSIFLMRMASLICAIYVIFYLLYFWIKSYDNLLIYSTGRACEIHHLHRAGMRPAVTR